MMRNLGLEFKRPGLAPSLYLRIGPLTVMRWPRDRPRWFLRRGVAYLLAGSVGMFEVLFWELKQPRRVDRSRPRVGGYPAPPVRWNPFNKVVLDHRDGTIDREATDRERERRGLPVPWEPAMGDREVREVPVY